MISAVCTAFACTPNEAMQQDEQLVQAVLDYRVAEQALELFNAKDKRAGFEALASAPYLLQVLAWMRRAQDGRPLDGADTDMESEGMAVAAAHREDKEPDEG